MNRFEYIPCRIVHEDGTEHFDVRSFHYDAAGTPLGWSVEASRPGGETVEQLKNDIRLMSEGIEKTPLVLFVYTCEKCAAKDARTEQGRKICKACELTQPQT